MVQIAVFFSNGFVSFEGVVGSKVKHTLVGGVLSTVIGALYMVAPCRKSVFLVRE